MSGALNLHLAMLLLNECYCVVQVFNLSPSRLFVMPDAAFRRDKVSSQAGVFLNGQQAVSYNVASNIN